MWHAEGSGHIAHLEAGLISNFVARRFIGELGDELIRLDVNILFAWQRLRRLYVACEELLRSLRPLLLEPFRIKRFLIGVEQLVGVRASRDNHGCVGGTPEYALIIGNILRDVFLTFDAAIRILELGFCVNDSRLRSAEPTFLL